MRKPVLIAAVVPLLFTPLPAYAQLDADTGAAQRGGRTIPTGRPAPARGGTEESGERDRGGPAISSRLGGNSGDKRTLSDNRVAGNGNPAGSGGQPAGPNGNPVGGNAGRGGAPAGPNHQQDAANNIDATFGTANGAVVTPAPLTGGSSNEINAAATTAGPRERVNGNKPGAGRGVRATPGSANAPGGGFTPTFNGNANMTDNSVLGGRGNDNGGGNSLDTGRSNLERPPNENGDGTLAGGGNSTLGGFDNSIGAPDAGTGPEWNGNDPDAADNGVAARRGTAGGRGGGRGGGSSDTNSGDGAQGPANTGEQDPAVTRANGNRQDDSGPSGGDDGDAQRQQERNSDGGNAERDSGGGDSGGENDNKPSAQSGGGAPDRPEEEFGGSGNPFSRAIAGRRAGEIVGRGLGRDVTGEHREEERQDIEGAGAVIGGRRNVLTGEQAVTAPNAKGPSPLLRKVVKEAQERKKSQ